MGITPDTKVERLLRHLTHQLSQHLPETLLGLYLHGSLVTGDFNPERSDIDLLAVLSHDPSEQTIEHLQVFHSQLDADEPAWCGRVEINYISVAALESFRTQPRLMARISPGEPLHLVPATRHYLLQWYMAWYSGVALFGPPPQQIMPGLDRAEFVAVVREHASNWKVWIAEMDPHHAGSHVYGVLTLCRALYSATTGEQVSKKQAAKWAALQLPEWASLIEWAVTWWYGSGEARPRPDFSTVKDFIAAVSNRITDISE
ncbi:aminoglycoside adenylyltransferase domain-containing protein [Deinococcus saxicola]|uniref:aminoglycoside adenylyltransferase domain-containing protein n=1 Tax=Deinococcus saxicola TaxID=249406 RepID=UPI0039F01380